MNASVQRFDLHTIDDENCLKKNRVVGGFKKLKNIEIDDGLDSDLGRQEHDIRVKRGFFIPCNDLNH